MARRVIAGHSYKEVAYWANEHGHQTTTGKLFYPVTIRNMLRKPRYGGIREYQGSEYPGAWQPVFDPENWDRLQLTMKLRQERRGSDVPIARKYLLTGLTFCGICGTPLNGSAKRDRASVPLRRVYHCRTAGDTTRRHGCGGATRNANALDDFISELVFFRLDTPALERLLKRDDPTDDRLRQLLADRKAQQERLDGLADDYVTGLLTRQQVARATETGKAVLRGIAGEIDALNRQRASTGLVPVGETVRQAWKGSESDSWRQTLLGMLIERIVVNPGLSKPYYLARDGKRYRFAPELIDVRWRC